MTFGGPQVSWERVLLSRFTRNKVSLEVLQGDITEFSGDAIVNPANTLLIMGGGVAGAIKRKGGDVIESEARKYAPLPIGEAIVTTGGRLRCKFVIHSPTVQYPGSPSTFEQVYKATRAALIKAKEIGVKSIALPLMGAGVGGLKPEESLESMLKAIVEVGEGLRIHLVIKDRDIYGVVTRYLESAGWCKEKATE